MIQQPSKPLSLLGLECVFQKMEANKRFQIASCCLALRKLHQKIPAKIDDLKITESIITVNGIEHILQSHVVNLKNAIDQLLDYDFYSFGESYAELDLREEDFDLNPPVEQFNEFKAIERDLDNKFKACEHFKVFIKYSSTTKPQGMEFPDGVRMRDVIRSLLKFLVPTNSIVKRLEIPIKKGVIRIPPNFRIRISELKVQTEKIPQFLDPASFPLKRLSVELRTVPGHLSVNPIFQNPILQGAEILELSVNFINLSYEECVQTCSTLENLVIHLSGFDCNAALAFVGVYRSWVENPRKLGAKLSVDLNDVNLFKQALANARGVPAVIPSRTFLPFQHGSTCQIGGNLELNIYGWKYPNKEEWRVVMEVMELGSAEISEC